MTTQRTSAASQNEAVEELLDLAEDALDHGDPHRGIALCAQVLQAHPEHAGALFVTADAYRDLGFLVDAEQAYRRVTSIAADHAPAWSGLSVVLFDQLRFEEARRAALRSLRLDPLSAEASYIRGLLRERRGDLAGAERDFCRASRVDPSAFPRPLPLTDESLHALVREAASTLHPAIQSYLEQVPILLEDVPSVEVCEQFEPPAPPSELLGIFTPAGVVSPGKGAWSQLPSTIVVFRRNLQRLAVDPAQLLAELRITVFYEVGHYLGIAETELEPHDPE